MNIKKLFPWFALMVGFIGCTQPSKEQPTNTNSEVPTTPQVSEEPNYQQTATTLPSDLYLCSSSTVYPYMILDFDELQKGRLRNVEKKTLDDYSYIFNFSSNPFFVAGKGTATLATYAQATKTAFKSTEYTGDRSVLHRGGSYGFQEANDKISLFLPIGLDPFKNEPLSGNRKNVFYAEYYIVNFSVEAAPSAQLTGSGKAYVSTLYYGSYARIVLTTNRKRSEVIEAFNERRTLGQSKKWDEIINDGELHLSLSHTQANGTPINSDQFFALEKEKGLYPKPILFSVTKLN